MPRLFVATIWLSLWAGVAQGGLGVSFNKAFDPATVAPDTVSTLTFTITNSESNQVADDLAFVDNLPAGMTIAKPAGAVNECGGTLTAPDGGTTISLTDGGVGASSTCTVSVNVVGTGFGTLSNVSGDLTSSLGNSGAAIADLALVFDRPAFSKSFTPSQVGLGQRSTLDFLIDYSFNEVSAPNLTFTDTLPAGLVIADPANASTTCSGGVITAVPGTDLISYAPQFTGDAIVQAGDSCTVSVDVLAQAVGQLVNISGSLTHITVQFVTLESGKATAALEVTADAILLVKSFTDDPVRPGDGATLNFELTNLDRNQSATGLTFSDDLGAALNGLVASGLPLNNICGNGSSMTGTGLLAFAGGSLGPGEVCSFDVPLQVPGSTPAGEYINTTSDVTATVGGAASVSGPGVDSLFVTEAPILTKDLLTDSVPAGGTTTMQFTVGNISSTSAATDIAFTDNLAAFVNGVVPTLPPAGFCGAGSVSSAFEVGGELILSISGANLAAAGNPGDSCTFDVPLQLPNGVPEGDFVNQTSTISATVNGTTQTGPSASDTITVIGAPEFTKSFIDDPVLPGDTATLEFTITHSANAPTAATEVTFDDDLGATLAGLVATGLPLNDVCGSGSGIAGTSSVTLTGGRLGLGESCTFAIDVIVPGTALPGRYTNTTSDLTATVAALTVTGTPAEDDLVVAGLNLSKQFIDDPYIPGDVGQLEFTIDNTDGADAATAIGFTDELNSTLSGLTATGLSFNSCGGTVSFITPSSILLTDGAVAAGATCTIVVDLQIPTSAAPGDYTNVTSALQATINATVVSLDPASDSLLIDPTRIALTKTFLDDPVAPGGTVDLEFTLTNQDALREVTAVGFTDDLNAFLPGLSAIDTPIADVCGTASQITGTTLLSITGGTLGPGASCTFGVTLAVPSDIPLGDLVNTTSAVTGTIDPLLNVTGDPASDTLGVAQVTFSKSFPNDGAPGAIVTVDFAIANLSPTQTITDLSFNDDLNAFIAGAVATGLPATDVCGAGSSIEGTSTITLRDGILAGGETCDFSVSIRLAGNVGPGDYLNTTSALTSSGSQVAPAASDSILINPPPLFGKSFTPDRVGETGTSLLEFVIDNSASTVAASALDFTDTLPAGLAVATPSGAAVTCSGGVVTAAPGSGAIGYTGGSVAAGATCTVTVTVVTSAQGSLVNTSGDLTSSSGNSGTATDTITVIENLIFSDGFEG